MRNVSIERKYLLTCEHCDWKGECPSAGIAEQMAKDHIHHEDSYESNRPCWSHTVRISEVTVVGRNI